MIDTFAAPSTARATYTNVHLQLPDRAVHGSIVVEDGRITEIAEGVVQHGIDGGGAVVIPGLIELHTDNVETAIAPRPRVRWPVGSALLFHDRVVTAAGITTVCDAISIGESTSGASRLEFLEPVVAALDAAIAAGRLAADHRLHLRCELGYADLLAVIERFAGHPRLLLLSLMDHTPGQRQFADVERFESYYTAKYGVPRDRISALVEKLQRNQREIVPANRAGIVALARERGIPLATHDDGTLEHVAEAVADGAVIAEFPTTLEAARAAHEAGMAVLMGSPNLVLGGSQSGNVGARELVDAGLVDVFSSDYVPLSLVQVPFTLAALTGKPLFETLRCVTSAPAEAIGLGDDRGSIAIGKRADLAFVDASEPTVRVAAVLRDGVRVA
ncbi:MAG TPA: alpha-D-ribose 1-methylphosphonate 5-triphosphate diphosphatase [Candidatus Elarobacter sp.]|jgi:alpha-D-ribose 1-methylphosphonate 5-triphosphate diphosphatase